MQDGARVAIETEIDRLTQDSGFPPSERAVVLYDAIECIYIMQDGLDCGRRIDVPQNLGLW